VPDQLVPLSELSGDALELSVELRPDPQGVVGLALRRSPDGAEETRISYDGRPQQLIACQFVERLSTNPLPRA